MRLRIVPAVVAWCLCFVQAQVPPPSSNFCFTPDGQEGECVSISSCQHVSSLLEEPDDDKTAFVRASVCSGAAEYSVCCGSHPPEFMPPPTSPVCSSTTALPWPKSGCCGVETYTSDIIIGGVDASIDQYPWMALIEYTKGTHLKLLCGGALISGRYVLTAAHCVVGPVLDSGIPRNVRLGEYDTSNDPKNPDCVTVLGGTDCTTGVVVIPIEKVNAHEEYNPNNRLRRHDIALLLLTRMAPYSDFIKPICLPLTDITLANLPDIQFYVAGWGAVNETHSKSLIKQHVDVPYRTKDQCQPAYSVARRKVALWNGQICAGGASRKDSCRGDSGGPLMYENGKTFEIVGVVSFGPTPCGIEDVPGVYTKVFEYLPWIRKNIKPSYLRLR